MAWDLTETIDWYKKQGAPRDQSAVMSLLREVQRECGGSIPQYALTAMAEGCGVKEAKVKTSLFRTKERLRTQLESEGIKL